MSDTLPNLDGLLTEQRNPNTMELDTFTPLQITEAMNREDGPYSPRSHRP